MGNICTAKQQPLAKPNRRIRIPSHLQDVTLSIGSFTVNRVLSRRTLGKVLLVSRSSTGEMFAIKTVKKSLLLDRKLKKHAMGERNVLAEIRSEFVVKLHFAFQNAERLYLVLEYMQGGELFCHFRQQGKFKFQTARFYAAEILMALEDLHQHNIIYRDLKLENVLLTAEGYAKLADFNLAKLTDDEYLKTRTICGTPEYLSPEVIKGCDQTYKVDYWSLGILVYEMLEGVTPFYAQTHERLFANIMACKLEFSYHTPPSARRFIEAMLKLCPWDRPKSSDEIKSMDFFADVDWEMMRSRKVKPPITPKVNLCMDASPDDSPEHNQRSGENTFKGFSYISSPFK